MEFVLNIAALLVAGLTLVLIAFPHLLFPSKPDDTEKVGAVYWGVYDGQSTHEPERLKTIEVKKTPGKEKVVAGSGTYALGRGTNMRT